MFAQERRLARRQLEEWRRDGWKLLSVVPEGGAVRAIVEWRRRLPEG